VYPSTFISALSDKIMKTFTLCEINTKQMLPENQEKIKIFSQNVIISLDSIITSCDNYV
jgi:hypothetical protein